MITVFQKFIRKNIYLITYEALTSKPLMICNFCFGYLLIRYYQSLMLNIDEIRDVRVTNLEILFTFLYSISYIYIYWFLQNIWLFFKWKSWEVPYILFQILLIFDFSFFLVFIWKLYWVATLLNLTIQ